MVLGTFTSDPTKIHKIVLAESFKVPVCEYKLSNIRGADDPITKLTIISDLVQGREGDENADIVGSVRDPKKWKYDTWYRIDQVIFEPIEEKSTND